MIQVQSGQCGLCTHFGENTPSDPKVIQIRVKHEAPEGLVEECGHPTLASLNLMVTATSGCAAFQLAPDTVQA